MTTDVTVVKQEDSLSAVVALFEKLQINRVPVVDDEQRLIGIVSRANFVRALAASEGAERASVDADDDIRRGRIHGCAAACCLSSARLFVARMQ